MKLTKAQIYAKESNPLEGLLVLVEDVGWLHIAKLPFDCNNIFFSKEEIEIVVGEKLVLVDEQDIDDTSEKMLSWKEAKGLL